MCIKKPIKIIEEKLDRTRLPISPYLDILNDKSKTDNAHGIERRGSGRVYKTVCTQCSTVLSPTKPSTLSVRLCEEEDEQWPMESTDELLSKSPIKLSHGLCHTCFRNMDADLDLTPLNIGPRKQRRSVLSTSLSSQLTYPLPPPPSPPRVLIVDDNRLQRQIHKRMVEQEGYECEVAESGAEAIEKIKKGRFTAVMMDLVMSPMDGWTTARRIRGGQGSAPSSPGIVAVTGLKVDDKLRAQCTGAGIDDVVQKPISPRALGKLLQTISKPYT